MTDTRAHSVRHCHVPIAILPLIKKHTNYVRSLQRLSGNSHRVSARFAQTVHNFFLRRTQCCQLHSCSTQLDQNKQTVAKPFSRSATQRSQTHVAATTTICICKYKKNCTVAGCHKVLCVLRCRSDLNINSKDFVRRCVPATKVSASRWINRRFF